MIEPFIEPEPTEDAREGYKLRDDFHAQWALDRLRAHQRELQRLQEAARARRTALEANEVYQEIVAELESIADWEADVSSGPTRSIEWLSDRLTEYVAQRVLEDPDTPKTYRLPNGEIARRKSPDRIVVDEDTDEEGVTAFARWCVENGRLDLLRITPRLDAIKLCIEPIPEDHEAKIPGPTVMWINLKLDRKRNPYPDQEGMLIDPPSGEEIPGVVYVVGADKIQPPKPKEP